NMNGFAHFFIEQAKEEYMHAMKFYDYIFDMDGRVMMQAIPEPKNEFDSYLAVFEEALAHEEEVTSRIRALVKMAVEESSFDTMQFLNWFLEEQREEENTMKDIIFKLEGIKDNFQGLYMLDKELGARPQVSTTAVAEE
ncbi:MAG TPA: ferritin, partial [Tissierellaceae bacterium]